MPRCLAITKHGKICKNQTIKYGEKHCAIHKNTILLLEEDLCAICQERLREPSDTLLNESIHRDMIRIFNKPLLDSDVVRLHCGHCIS